MTSVIMLGTRRCLCPWALPSALLLLLHALVAAALHAPQGPATVQRWGMLQLNLTGPAAGATGAANPFVDVSLNATFVLNSVGQNKVRLACAGVEAATWRRCRTPTTMTVSGFFDGGDQYRVRFSPPHEGTWAYFTVSTAPSLDGHRGSVEVQPATANNHGPVESRGYGLYYADGTPHFSVGTTCYQWASKGSALQQATLQTLREGPQGAGGPVFNKIRMTVFPKWYDYNHANPVEMGTAFDVRPGSVAANATAWGCVGNDCPPTAGSYDLRRFNVSFWQHYEGLVGALQEMGVVADVIVFHPYDGGHWGFDCLGGRNPETYDTANDDFYLRYLAARLSAYSNVWWAMANEWSFCTCKSRGINSSHLQSPAPVWDKLFETLSSADPYTRQMSIHNGNLLYNHSRPWITHVSLQSLMDQTPSIRSTYRKPVVWDEERYEGDIPSEWGGLSGEEETDRFWTGASLGVYVGHSETILRPGISDDRQPLWWAKGGLLIGTSPLRIRWFRSIWTTHNITGALPDFGALVPTQESYGESGSPVANALTDPGGRLIFLHFTRSGTWTVPLPKHGAAAAWTQYTVDYWGMIAQQVPLPATAVNVTITAPDLPYNVLLTAAV